MPSRAIAFFFAGWVLAAQTTPLRPEFEVANVKPNHSGAADYPSSVAGSQVSFRSTTIADLFPLAFQRKGDLIVGGPAWLRTERFDITAKAPPNTSEATLGLMVQSLLAKEFKLAFHEEQRSQDAFVLEVAPSGPKLREVPADPSRPDCSRGGTTELLVVECPAVTIANLIPRLLFAARDFIDRPIVDQTGLTRNYQLKLEWVPRRIAEETGGLTIFQALTKQLGLKLVQRKVPVPVIVIDHAELPAN